MERTRFVDHRGTRILLLDYSGARDPEEAIRAIEHSTSIVAQHPPKSLLVLTTVRDARYNAAVLQALKELAKHDEPFVKASAIVGMSGLHRIAYQAVLMFSRRNIRAFEDDVEAMDWLVSQA
jgi:hypothetical protein